MEQASQKGFSMIGSITIVAIAVLLGGGFLYFRTTSQVVPEDVLQNQQSGAQSPVSDETPALEIDTANWKTYRNEEYKFEFQYPVNFKEYKTDEKEVRIANFDWEEGNYDRPSNAVLIYAYAGDPFQNYLYSPEGYEQEEKNFILDGEKAIISAVKNPEENNGNTVISVATIKNGVYYAVEIIPWSESNEELFDKVLSTFRFIK